MRKISESEKKQIVGGAGRRKSPPKTFTKSKFSAYNTKLHNISLLSLVSIPGIISLGEEVYSLISGGRNYSNKSNSNFNQIGRSNFQGNYLGGESSMNNRRDFFAYASEAFRPMIRFSPYYYKSGISFGIPWFV